ncbi:hypothetical protein G6F62_010735 [Rhizopus arrhizus]|nr:hypothetical protein G6F62_010735 [Rhizopus arrhizus]
MSNSIQTRLDNLYNCNTINGYPTCYVFKRLDRATSMQFNLYRKQRQQQRTNSLFIHKSQINNRTSDMSEDEDEILNVLPCTIHKAVRKNASVIRIEKTTTKTNHQHKPTFIHGLITPPESPFNQNVFDNQLSLPLLIHAHKKTHSLKGLVNKTFRLNQYTINKASSASDGPLLTAFNTFTGESKLILKLNITLPDKTTNDQQKRFGFTFQPTKQNDHVKLSLIPDSLVKEALVNWMNSQGEHDLPPLTKADEIIRDKKKIYVVYDSNL